MECDIDAYLDIFVATTVMTDLYRSNEIFFVPSVSLLTVEACPAHTGIEDYDYETNATATPLSEEFQRIPVYSTEFDTVMNSSLGSTKTRLKDC